MSEDREKILKSADYINKDALWLIDKILQKHSAAILEEMRDQLRSRDAKLETATKALNYLRPAVESAIKQKGLHEATTPENITVQWTTGMDVVREILELTDALKSTSEVK